MSVAPAGENAASVAANETTAATAGRGTRIIVDCRHRPTKVKVRVENRRTLRADVRDAVGGRSAHASREACQRDERGEIRQRLQQLARNARTLERELQRREEAEEQRRARGTERRPASEDDGGERDEAAARRHPVRVQVELGEREVDAAERRDRAARDDGPK